MKAAALLHQNRSMSTSSSSHLNQIVSGNDRPNCFCPLPAKERESWKIDNPDRRFHNCPKSLVAADNCNFFRWLDPPLPQHYKDMLLNMKRRLEAMTNCAELEKLEKQKALRASEKLMAEQEIAKLREELAWTRKKFNWGMQLLLACVVVLGVFVGVTMH